MAIGSDVLVVLLVAVLILELATASALVVLWRRNERLRAENAALRRPTLDGTPRRALQAAGWAVRTVVDTADRVRERGFVGGLLMTPIEELARWAQQDQEEIAAVAMPDGTVAFLFSDIEDSTRLNEELGDRAWVRLLGAHDRVVREAVHRHAGHVVKTQGDGFMVVFGAPEEALACAVRIQERVGVASRRLRRTPVRVRIGIHVGRAVSRDGDYFGREVAKAARVAALAEGGQVLVTEEVRAAVGTAVGAAGDVTLEPAGSTELKGLTGTHELHAVTTIPTTTT